MKKIIFAIIILLILVSSSIFFWGYNRGCHFSLKIHKLNYDHYSRICSAWLYSPSHDGLNDRSCEFSNPHVKTLEVLSPLYSKDKNNVYYVCKVIKDADPTTFQILSGAYTKDKNNIFVNGKRLENIDGDTFEYLNYGYTKDKYSVYFNDEKLSADVLTFKLLTKYHEKKGTSVYGKDKNNIFYYGKIVLGANPTNFQILEDGYATDNNNIFFLGKKIDDADASSFEIISDSNRKSPYDAQDKYYKYKNGDKI